MCSLVRFLFVLLYLFLLFQIEVVPCDANFKEDLDDFVEQPEDLVSL